MTPFQPRPGEVGSAAMPWTLWTLRKVKAVEASAAASSRKQQIHEEHKRPRMDLNAMRLPAKKTGDGSAARWRVWRRLSGSATPRRTEERRARRQEHQEQNSNGNGWQW